MRSAVPPSQVTIPSGPPFRLQVSGETVEVGSEVIASLLLDSLVAVVGYDTLIPGGSRGQH